MNPLLNHIHDAIKSAVDEVVEEVIEKACEDFSKKIRDHAAKVVCRTDSWVSMDTRNRTVHITIKIPGTDVVFDPQGVVDEVHEITDKLSDVEKTSDDYRDMGIDEESEVNDAGN